MAFSLRKPPQERSSISDFYKRIAASRDLSKPERTGLARAGKFVGSTFGRIQRSIANLFSKRPNPSYDQFEINMPNTEPELNNDHLLMGDISDALQVLTKEDLLAAAPPIFVFSASLVEKTLDMIPEQELRNLLLDAVEKIHHDDPAFLPPVDNLLNALGRARLKSDGPQFCNY